VSNVLSEGERIGILASLVDGNSVRATERMTGVGKQAILRLLNTVGDGCARVHDGLMRELRCQVLELDEVWSYVGKHQARLDEADPPEYGDTYTWLAVDAAAKLIPSWRVSKRGADDCVAFAADLRARVVGAPQLSTDGYRPYVEAVEATFGAQVHYAQVIKTYWNDEASGASREEVRYGRGRVKRCIKRALIGRPDLERANTSYAERGNLTLRMNQRRFTRLTNGYSKCLRNLRAAVGLYVAHFNLCRVHMALRVTPAMQAGVTDRVWSLAELLDAALTAPEPPPLALPPLLPTGAVYPRRLPSAKPEAGQLTLPGVE
jgi:IS1 family transposase